MIACPDSQRASSVALVARASVVAGRSIRSDTAS